MTALHQTILARDASRRPEQAGRGTHKTVELIVAQRDWDPPAPRVADDALVAVRVAFAEVAMRQQVKQAGGQWNPSRKVWEPRYAQVIALKPEARIVEEAASDTGCRG